jgi:hypothetical protein
LAVVSTVSSYSRGLANFIFWTVLPLGKTV